MKKLLSLVLATTMLTSVAFASGTTIAPNSTVPGDTVKQEKIATDTDTVDITNKSSAQTDFYVVATTDATSINVTVPLYVVYAVSNESTGTKKVLAPSTYQLENSGNATAYVTSAMVNKLTGSIFTLVSDNTCANAYEFYAPMKFTSQGTVPTGVTLTADTTARVAAYDADLITDKTALVIPSKSEVSGSAKNGLLIADLGGAHIADATPINELTTAKEIFAVTYTISIDSTIA